MKLKHLLYIILITFAIVPMLIFGLFMMYENDRKIDSIMRENLEAIAGMQILDIKNFCESSRERMEMLSNYDIVQDSIKESIQTKGNMDEARRVYLDNMLQEQKHYSSFIVSLSIVDREFRVVASSEAYDVQEMSALSNVKEEFLKGDFIISNVYERETTDGVRRVVDAIQGVHDRDGELIGYIAQEIATTYFDKNRMETNLWDNGTLYILDGSNQLITAGGAKEESRTEFVTDYEERESYTKAWNAIDHEANPSGEITYVINRDEYVTYFSNLDYTDWSIRLTVNLSTYKEQGRTFRILMSLTLQFAVIVVVIVMYFIARRLTQPINQIVGTMEKVQSTQDYSLRIKYSRKDELGYLSHKINDLLEYIQKENMLEKEHQRNLERKAQRDSLTGVRNKKAIEDAIQQLVLEAVDIEATMAVGFVDIDDFKDYNTKYGHQEGDHVITFVASVLKDTVDGRVGRNGGDEFLFCMMGKDLDQKRIEAVAEELMAKFREGVLNHKTGEKMPIPCSMGIIIQRGKKMSYSSLIQRADMAMYEAKEAGKNCYHICFEEL